MKKLLGISLVAVLAVTPLMARADTNPSAYALKDGLNAQNEPDSNEKAESGQTYSETLTPVAEKGKYFKGKVITSTDAETAATGAYVKGAYNAAISAINKVAETSADVDLSNLSSTGTGVINTAITNNAAGANYDNDTSELQATTIQGAIDEVEGRVDTLEGTVDALGGTYATKTGVVDTIESSSVNGVSAVSLSSNGAVSAYTDWNSESTASLGGASLSVTTGYMPVVVTATKSSPEATTYDVKYRDGSTQQPAATGTQPSTTPAP